MTELQPGEYTIPDGYMMEKIGDIYIVRKSKRVEIHENRCKNCKYFGKARITINAWYESDACLMKPKKVGNKRFQDQKLYYGAKPTGKICDKFELKEDTDV